MEKKYIALLIILGIFIVGAIYAFGVNYYVKKTTKKRMYSFEGITDTKINDIDCILVLGAGVKEDGRPSNMLEDRLITSIKLYNHYKNIPILVSGDHGRKEYDEVNTMKKYLIDNGIPENMIFMDHAGFSTYESIYRARKIFEVKKAIVVTQEYHLYRAMFIGDKLDVDTYGVSSSIRSYGGQSYFDFREFLARNKDFLKTIIKPKPTYLGEVIPISGDGNATNDY
jgi:Uncharacterized membrane protein